jgi:hypothetical protein
MAAKYFVEEVVGRDESALYSTWIQVCHIDVFDILNIYVDECYKTLCIILLRRSSSNLQELLLGGIDNGYSMWICFAPLLEFHSTIELMLTSLTFKDK